MKVADMNKAFNVYEDLRIMGKDEIEVIFENLVDRNPYVADLIADVIRARFIDKEVA